MIQEVIDLDDVVRGDRGLVVDSFDEGLEWRIQRGAGKGHVGGLSEIDADGFS